MPNGTMYIGIVREPFSHFRSFIRFLQPKYVLGIPGQNLVLEYLSRKVKKMSSTGRFDTLCYFMAFYLGFPKNLRLKDGYKIQNYLLKLDKELDIVLVVEFLDESIVLMRRILNWDLRYVLYGKLRVNKVENNLLKFGTNEENIHKRCAYLNNRLYNFFVHKLKQKIESQSPDFYDELTYFRKTRMKYNNFCLSAISEDHNNPEVVFEGTAWNKPFVITKKHCESYIFTM
ncbi:Galactose-3-O-sulfotransferase 3 [Mizuhopecten yessoensis]|uniref:Galactose-3-O-sulfotransferase 3 n=1 Tax=Mizuhopecten yessoensis TaxID=6573 RepID=A0A210Q7C8_MIZYE|nr:Galactose-3-O-sulfotransferase 3 [Mizuhopecten yessoensis]